jgi:hypothetical protein
MPLYAFQCFVCKAVTEKILKPELRPKMIKCESCPDGDAEYIVGAPAHFRIAIDGNGRKGYKMDMGNGKKVVRSATRERYEHEAGNRNSQELTDTPGKMREHTKSVYTKEYGRKVEAEKKEKMKNLEKAIVAIKQGEK